MMGNEQNLHKVFEGILASQSFELLQHFVSDETWGDLGQEEKEMLAQLFLLRAEEQTFSFEEGEAKKSAKIAYQSACKLLPQSAMVWYRIGAFLALEDSQEDLKEAIGSLEQAIALDSGFFDAHYTLASACLRLGVMKQEYQLFIDASTSFSRAELLMYDAKSIPGDFYWHWGLTYFFMARHSGEPADLIQSIHYFARAKEKLVRADFFNDYANALVELGLFLNRYDYIQAAISLYREALAISEDRDYDMAVRWFNLGCCYQYIFEETSKREDFDAAHKAFTQASIVFPDLHAVWPRWGALLFRAAQMWDFREFAEVAVQKFLVAEEKDSEDSVVCAMQAQLYSGLAIEYDEIQYLQKAHTYVQRVENISKELRSPDLWAAMAWNQYAHGTYFQDSSYLTKSIEILREALISHRKSSILWYLLAMVKADQSKLLGTRSLLKESLLCFLFAARSTSTHFPRFWYEWGKTLMVMAERTGDHAYALEAVAKIELAMQHVPSPSSHWKALLAESFERVSDFSEIAFGYEQAAILWEDIYQNDSHFPLVQAKLASCYLRQGELSDDAELFQRAISLFEAGLVDSVDNELLWAEYGLALVHEGRKNAEENEVPASFFLAEDAFLRAISLGNIHAYYQLGCLYALMGNASEALQQLYKALSLDALPQLQDILEDPWLHSIHQTVMFHEFLYKVELHLQNFSSS